MRGPAPPQLGRLLSESPQLQKYEICVGSQDARRWQIVTLGGMAPQSALPGSRFLQRRRG